MLPSLLIVDDHPVILAGLREAIRDSYKVEYVMTVEAAQLALLHENFSIALLDFYIGTDTCVQLASTISNNFPQTKLCVLTSHISRTVVEQLAPIQPIAILDKNMHINALRDHLATIELGGCSYSPNVTRYCFEIMNDPSSSNVNLLNSLKAIELQLLKYTSEGKSAKEIASICMLSISQVNSMRRDIKRKLSASSMNQLVALYQQNQHKVAIPSFHESKTR